MTGPGHNGDFDRDSPDTVWVGDLVHDPVTGREASVLDVRSDGTYLLRTPRGFAQWPAADPARLQVVTKRTDRTDW